MRFLFLFLALMVVFTSGPKQCAFLRRYARLRAQFGSAASAPLASTEPAAACSCARRWPQPESRPQLTRLSVCCVFSHDNVDTAAWPLGTVSLPILQISATNLRKTNHLTSRRHNHCCHIIKFRPIFLLSNQLSARHTFRHSRNFIHLKQPKETNLYGTTATLMPHLWDQADQNKTNT